ILARKHFVAAEQLGVFRLVCGVNSSAWFHAIRPRLVQLFRWESGRTTMAMPCPALLSRRRRLAVWGGRKGRTPARKPVYNCGPATPEGGAEAAVWHGLCALSLS